MKFVKVEFSKRAMFIGVYITPDKNKMWICPIPFIAFYFKSEKAEKPEETEDEETDFTYKPVVSNPIKK